jgi:predicted nuclease with TOPRIM domain
MWNAAKQQQLDTLQRQEAEGSLTTEGLSTLEHLLHELEQEEWNALRPALGRLHAERVELRKRCGQLRSQNARLGVLLERQENILARGRAHLVELLSEHDVLKTEYEHITGQPLSPPS